MDKSIGCIGIGAMGGALMQAIRNTFTNANLTIFDKDQDKLTVVSKSVNAAIAGSISELISSSDIVFLAVKPTHMEQVLSECRGDFSVDTLFISIAVSLPLSLYQNRLGYNTKVVRTMPNAPALIGEGITFFCSSPSVDSDDKNLVVSLLACAGHTEEIDEALMDEVTALTGSSPAFFFTMIEAMGDAAVLSGVPRDKAYKWAAVAMAGSAKMVLQTGKHPAELRDMVASPAGSTIEGIASLEKNGFRSAVIEAMSAVTRKAKKIHNEI